MKEKITKNNFSCMLSLFCVEYMTREFSYFTFETVLETFAKAVCLSVLKVCIDPERKKPAEKFLDKVNADGNTTPSDNGYNKTLCRIYADLTREKYLVNMNTDTQDFFQETTTIILEKCSDMEKRFGYIDMEMKFPVYKYKKKVIINSINIPEQEETQTTLIQEIYRAVRRYIQKRFVRPINSKFAYVSLDEIMETESELFFRLVNKSDLIETVYDFNGKEVANTSSVCQVLTYNAMLEKLNLTERQLQLVNLRMQGLSISDISEKLNVKTGTVKKHFEKMQEKAGKVLDLDGYNVSKENVMTGKNKLSDSDKKEIVSLYKKGFSMGEIAKKYNISKMTVCRAVNA